LGNLTVAKEKKGANKLIRMTTEKVSARMKKIKRHDTRLEREMEKILRRMKIKYNKQPNIKGCPDFQIRETNVLIFCDSSFWHGRRKDEVSGKAFRRNTDFWVKKLNDTKKRDIRNNNYLRRNGWSVYRFWDTDVSKKPDKVETKLIMAIKGAKKT